MTTTRKVAVIAIHGVADQKAGDTAMALAVQLLTQSPNGGQYVAGTRAECILATPLLQPARRLARVEQGLTKRLNQSVRSDFLRREGVATNEHRELAESLTGLTPGAQFTDYLLAKAAQGGASAETYTAMRTEVKRVEDLSTADVHIWEMYWADLSRLSGSVPRILTELFTLLFRLSSLGRDTVQAGAALFRANAAWRRLQCLQTCLDWLYSRGLALLFLQLIMLALLLVPSSLASHDVQVVRGAICILAGVGVALFTAYRMQRLAPGAIVGAVVCIVFWRWVSPVWVIGLVWLSLLTAVYDWWLRICEDRFRMVRPIGLALWLGVVVAVVLTAARHRLEPDLGLWIHGALYGVELVLLLIVIWWGVVGTVLLPLWLLTGAWACRTVPAGDLQSFQARACVATGRFGFVVSLGFFLVLSMASWALVNSGMKLAAQDYSYIPSIFQRASLPAADECQQQSKAPNGADCFLQERFTRSTETFSLITILLLILSVYLILVLLPSVLAELGVIRQQFMQLGTWLTAGYRWLDALLAAVVFVGVSTALPIGILLVWYRLDEASIPQAALAVIAAVGAGSLYLLKPLLITAASITVAISAAGQVLSRYVPWLRAPLDAALDVDNHFREFPRRAIPRARIFSRYFALLAHIASQHYDRVVIVSHSQGTVISAELLQYLKERAADSRTKALPDTIAHVWGSLAGKISLLTAGCPLRQLYAARFPVMYEWVIRNHGNRLGPLARDVGVSHWINIFATGDYIGRWLWSRPSVTGDRAIPMVDAGSASGETVYSPLKLTTVHLSALMGKTRERDVSIGAGAHTHYFDKDQRIFAQVVDALIFPK